MASIYEQKRVNFVPQLNIKVVQNGKYFERKAKGDGMNNNCRTSLCVNSRLTNDNVQQFERGDVQQFDDKKPYIMKGFFLERNIYSKPDA